MIRVKKGNCQLIGGRSQIFSELSVATISCAEVMAKDFNISVEEAIDKLTETFKEAYRRTKENEQEI